VQLNIIILFALIGASLWTVMTRSLLRSAIGLALSSIIVTILIFRLNSPLAAVFELSICAGLISVLFVSTISLTHPSSQQEWMQRMRERRAQFWLLPLILIILAVILSMLNIRPHIQLPSPDKMKDVRVVLWQLRPVEIMGQIIVLITGVFGVVILFKERIRK
jgi:NADH-quinone oxidoreductase subunit J